jgi:hypothetical protein
MLGPAANDLLTIRFVVMNIDSQTLFLKCVFVRALNADKDCVMHA